MVEFVVSERLFFDIGANRGEATAAAFAKGFTKAVALDPAPRMFALLAKNFLGDSRVVPLKLAVSDVQDERIEFYECGNGELNQGDGSSTMEISWLTDGVSRVTGMKYRTVSALTCTMDWLVERYGLPELVKIDVEGGEHRVIAGLSHKPKQLCFEWHLEYMDRHIQDLHKLAKVNGYTEFGLQFITHHLDEPTEYRPISEVDSVYQWIEELKPDWLAGGWQRAGGYTNQPDVGMIWVK